MIIPLYIYPFPEGPAGQAWRLVAEVAKEFPQLQIIAVVNPANGPGETADSNYQRGIRELQRAGVILVGYVHLEYGHRRVDLVAADLRRWSRLYPRVQGVFMDEVPDGGAMSGPNEAFVYLEEMRNLSTARAPVIGNTGVAAPMGYYGTSGFDIVVAHEERYWPSPGQRPPPMVAARAAALVYGDGVWQEERFRRNVRRYGYLFVNDHQLDVTAAGEYPWNYLPTNLRRQAELLSGLP